MRKKAKKSVKKIKMKTAKNKSSAAKKKTKKLMFQSPKGTRDILPEDQSWWERVFSTAKEIATYYNFKKIDPTIIEEADLFNRSVGQGTDIVEKQMFYLKLRRKNLVLRPEATASVVRSYLENGLSRLGHPLKLYYAGPMFRHEKPQAGRFWQFYQIGLEIIGGENDPVFDAELIIIASRILEELGFKNLNIQINSIGCKNCQPAFKKKLVSFYKNRINRICGDCRNRLTSNPFRLLDCKDEKCQKIKEEAPYFLDNLCVSCRNHFKQVLEFLDEINLPYFLNNNLVRGLDYYNRTVFEIFDGSSPLALIGGGRYDYLVEALGGRSTPATGFSIGVERVIEVMKANNFKLPIKSKKKVFVIHIGDVAKKKILPLIEILRKGGIPIRESLSKDLLKNQLRLANKEGAELALILGQKEVYEENIIIKNLKVGVQETIPIKKMVEEIKKRLK